MIDNAPESTATRSTTGLGILLAVLGAIGLVAAFALTLEKFHALEFPGDKAACDFSLIVQCTVNLNSAQGAVLGFPNPIIGLVCWPVVITIGMALLARARFARWFWIGLNVGVVFALGFVIWLMYQSIHILATLCPWCMLTWAVVIPLFWIVTLSNLRDGQLPSGPRVRAFASAAYGWIPLITLACYLVVALIAQLRLDVLGHLG
ncbi:MAG: vitamin K epoxide reductase family protein [Leifsonia sp.]